ncbi:MAG: DNA polymerase ligase N-terminal domain-containing protein [Minisyncoccales bacterium]
MPLKETLKKYKSKRNFSETSEPFSDKSTKKSNSKNKKKKPIFVIQEHNASHLHWDFRLELQGVLKSWAIPKKPPKQKNLKRLAIETEDHPLGYENFEGEIPEGNYGAGTVKIWDKGTYELLEHKEGKKIEFILHGKELQGKYVLIKTNYGSNKEQKEKSWILFRVG